MYVRYQGTFDSGQTGRPCGIFGVAWHMAQRGLLEQSETDEIQQVEAWFEEVLPNPPFYNDGNPQKAITWFKEEASTDMVARLDRIREIVERNGWVIEVVRRQESPGEVIYEDEYQIATV